MRLLVENVVTIGRSVDDVFAYVCNMERFGEWFPGVISITSLDGANHGQPGKTYLETVYVPLRGRRQIRVQVRDARAPHFLATEGQFRPLLPRMEIALQTTGAQTCTVTWRMFSRNGSAAVRYLLLPLARRVMRRRAAHGLAALKQRMEQGPAPTSC